MRIDDFLEKFNVKYEELEAAERDTLHEMYTAVQQTQLTPEKLKDHIAVMKAGVENELAKSDIGKGQDIFLKARLRNYLLLEAFLMSPERARQALEAALAGYKVS